MPTEPRQPARSPRIRALVADDSPAFVTAIARMLDRFGVTVVTTARDGAEAIDRWARHEPDLAVLDVDMPGTNGLDAAAELRRRSSSVRIVMVSVRDGPQMEADCRRAGADAFVSKIGIQRRLGAEIAVLFPAPAAGDVVERPVEPGGPSPAAAREKVGRE